MENAKKKKKKQTPWQRDFSEGFKYGKKKTQSEREDDYLESLGMEDGGVAKKQALKNIKCKTCKGNCNCE